MLGRRYLKVNNVDIPNAVNGFKYSYGEDETVSLSEAGTELVRVRRLDKLTITGTWHLTSFWKDKFEEWAKTNFVTVTFQGEEHTCRMRDFNPQLVENSEFTEGTDGLWVVTPTFTEI